MRDEREYTDFIHSLPCISCYTLSSFQVEFSHISALGNKGIASKVHFKHGVPQCRNCHQRIHTVGEQAFFKYDLTGIENLTKKLWSIHNDDKDNKHFRAWLAIHRFRLSGGYYKVNCDGGMMFIKDSNDLQRAMNWLTKLVIDKPKQLILEDAEKQRSDAQRKLKWVWNDKYGEYKGIDKDELHKIMKGFYFGTGELARHVNIDDVEIDKSMTDYIRVFEQQINDDVVRLNYIYAKGTTKDLSVAQMQKYLEWYQHKAEEDGFIMPIPDYYGLAMR
jgi:hypothetical protein